METDMTITKKKSLPGYEVPLALTVFVSPQEILCLSDELEAGTEAINDRNSGTESDYNDWTY